MKTACIKTPYALNRPGGYGRILLNGIGHNHSRVAYIEANNLTMEDIRGKVVRHLCNNCYCINPTHLILGSHKDNMEDKMRAGNWKGGQPKKLSDSMVAAIRADRISTEAALGKLYNVSRQTINNVRNFKSCYTTQH